MRDIIENLLCKGSGSDGFSPESPPIRFLSDFGPNPMPRSVTKITNVKISILCNQTKKNLDLIITQNDLTKALASPNRSQKIAAGGKAVVETSFVIVFNLCKCSSNQRVILCKLYENLVQSTVNHLKRNRFNHIPDLIIQRKDISKHFQAGVVLFSVPSFYLFQI